MPFPYDKYPWLNFQELNLAYFIKHFREIFQQWDQLYHDLLDWKDATDADLAEWKSAIESGISSWETGLLQSMEDWKDETETDISEWETATLSALNAWKTATTEVFEQIRTEAAASATAAAGSATSAQTALAGAQAAQAAAEAAAASVTASAAQIATNTADISNLKAAISETNSEIDKFWTPNYTTVNIYNNENDEIIDGTYSRGYVKLYDYSGDVVLSCTGRRATYFSDLHVIDTSGADMSVSFGDTIEYTSGTRVRQGKIITIPSGAAWFSFRYRPAQNENVMVTKGNTIDSVTYYAYSATMGIEDDHINTNNGTLSQVLSGLITESGNNKNYIDALDTNIKGVYVAPDGDDSNDGLTPLTPLATFARALSLSNFVFAKRGRYASSISIQNKKNVTIIPYDNDEQWTTSNQERQPIELYGGLDINKNDMSASGSIYSAPVSDGYQFTAVFISHSVAPIISGTNYRANVFVHYDSLSKKCKLKPVLSVADCEAEGNTFTWDGTTLYCNITDGTFNSITIEKSGIGVNIDNSHNIQLEDIACQYSYGVAAHITESSGIVLKNCEASYCAAGPGFQFENTNGALIECFATHNGADGFNFHGFGVSEMINCSGVYNFDDGCSHHDGCYGYIEGGEFSGNSKDGVTPAYGAIVNISNVLAENNTRHGICYRSTNSGHKAMTGIVSGCSMNGNQYGLGVQELCTVTAINCQYHNNSAGATTIAGTLNEYPFPQLPATPAQDGTYKLELTVANGSPSYSWVSPT